MSDHLQKKRAVPTEEIQEAARARLARMESFKAAVADGSLIPDETATSLHVQDIQDQLSYLQKLCGRRPPSYLCINVVSAVNLTMEEQLFVDPLYDGDARMVMKIMQSLKPGLDTLNYEMYESHECYKASEIRRACKKIMQKPEMDMSEQLYNLLTPYRSTGL